MSLSAIISNPSMKYSWIHCNSCCHEFIKRDRKFYVLSCKHVFCRVCMEKKSNSGKICPICKTTIKFMPINDQMDKEVKEYFDISGRFRQFNHLMNIMRFQNAQFKHYVKYCVAGRKNHEETVEYSRNQNHDQGSLKGSLTPTVRVGHDNIVCHDSGVVNDTNNTSENSSQASVVVDYSTVSSVNVNVQQETQQYPYVTNGVQTPVSCHYPQPASMPNTPHVMIPTPDINSYMYNPNSAPVDGNGSQLVEPFYQPYMQPYFYSAPVQAPPMGYITYYPSTPMGYSTVGPATAATSPQVVPAMPTINGNVQQ